MVFGVGSERTELCTTNNLQTVQARTPTLALRGGRSKLQVEPGAQSFLPPHTPPAQTLWLSPV